MIHLSGEFNLTFLGKKVEFREASSKLIRKQRDKKGEAKNGKKKGEKGRKKEEKERKLKLVKKKLQC